MRTLSPGQALPSLLFPQDLIDRFHHMQLNLMQEHEIAYGFHPSKIIDPQVISVKCEEKSMVGLFLEGTRKGRRKGMISPPVAFWTLSPEISGLMNALNPLIMGKLKEVSGSPDHEINAPGRQCAQCFLHQQTQLHIQQRALLFLLLWWQKHCLSQTIFAFREIILFLASLASSRETNSTLDLQYKLFYLGFSSPFASYKLVFMCFLSTLCFSFYDIASVLYRLMYDRRRAVTFVHQILYP